MAGGMDLGGSGKGGRKPLDTAINLVPFIDLMSVTISFLIMTAVWTQVGRLDVSNGGGTAVSAQEPAEPQVVATLLFSDRALTLSAGGLTFEPMPLVRDGKQRLDLTRLSAKLRELKVQLPDVVAITLNAEDSVRYEDLVRVIDECVGQGLPNVSIAGVAG
ncbi:MAG: ExbD/TolR family protein [Myxococcaceae bacterium]